MGAEGCLPAAGDRCECRLSSSKLLRTEAENKHLGFRDDIPRYQPLANSCSYIRGQDTAVPSGSDAGWLLQRHRLRGKRRAEENKHEMHSLKTQLNFNATSDTQNPR